ncbi:MAG: RloB domain-containing protein [Polyangiaceae bacterium]|nr:RloB domain-containing protein [Polyangiaceae bacterium]
MVSRRRHDDRPIGRRGPSREPKFRILVVCEGKVTERGYLTALRQAVRNPRVHVNVAGETGVPRTVVEIAIRLRDEAQQEARRQRDENLKWDEVWGVFDIDEHPKVEEARQLARANAIELAVSNPCFELWALLHFQDCRAHIERHAASAALRRHLPAYDKALDFAKMFPGYRDAVARSQALQAEAERHGEPGRNPTTGVYRLTELIRIG